MESEPSDTAQSSDASPKRDNWGSDIEFLMSCIAMSVGLGNVWRFPFAALQNGGGAFLIPYLIVLVVVGRPIYYLEMIVGQFSSRGSIKVYDLCPALRGEYVNDNHVDHFHLTHHPSQCANISHHHRALFRNRLRSDGIHKFCGYLLYDTDGNITALHVRIVSIAIAVAGV